jgi:hypothetical protein
VAPLWCTAPMCWRLLTNLVKQALKLNLNSRLNVILVVLMPLRPTFFPFWGIKGWPQGWALCVWKLFRHQSVQSISGNNFIFINISLSPINELQSVARPNHAFGI